VQVDVRTGFLGMYCGFFKLDEEPFNLFPDSKYLFLSQGHRQKLAGLAYGILKRKNFLVLTGDIGTGKTTLVSAALRYLPRDHSQFSVISNPTLTPEEILEMTLLNFGIAEIPLSKAERIHKLDQFCRQGDHLGKVSTVIFDEAHKLSLPALEEIRLLGNLNSLGIVLVGQNELDELLHHQELQALKQRICLWLTVEALKESEVEQYIRFRWMKAGGGQSPPFSQQAVAATAQWSRRVPRLINSLCDNALTVAFEEGDPSVELEHVDEAVKRLRLEHSVSTWNSPQPSGPILDSTVEGGDLATETVGLQRRLDIRFFGKLLKTCSLDYSVSAMRLLMSVKTFAARRRNFRGWLIWCWRRGSNPHAQ
jgi:general secretion pathway protein A